MKQKNRDKILKKAFEIWEASGHPEGQDMEHWLKAELLIVEEEAKSKAAAKNASSNKAPASKAPVEKTPAKKVAVKKAPVKKAPVKKEPAKKA